jgi:hypothetical protein
VKLLSLPIELSLLLESPLWGFAEDAGPFPPILVAFVPFAFAIAEAVNAWSRRLIAGVVAALFAIVVCIAAVAAGIHFQMRAEICHYCGCQCWS